MVAINPLKYLGNIFARGIGRIQASGLLADSLYFDDNGNLVLENSGGVVGFPGGGGVSADLTNLPTTSAVGDAPATGIRTTLVSPSDHTHGREAFGTPGTSAIGDTAAQGVAATVTRSDHRHAREAAGSPTTSAVGDSAATGAAATVALSDHRHGREAFGAPASLAVGGAAANGVATTLARSDHVHAVTNIISRGATILTPSGAVNVIVWRAPYACTVTNVRGYVSGATGSTINARRNGASNHLAAALTLSSLDTWMDGGAVSNTAYAAGDKLEIMVVTLSGLPSQIAIQVELTRP